MKSFNEGKDNIEILFKNSILQRFPNYAIFWEKFIGYRDDALPNLQPYGLKFPKNYSKTKRQKVEKIHLEINQIHHHIFCSLSGAHYELNNYLSNYLSSGAKSVFIRHNSLNSFYFHIGVCRDMINRLVKYILIELANENIRKPIKCDKCKKPIEFGYLNAFHEYLKDKDDELAKRFDEWKSRINKIRSRLSHYGSIGKLINNREEFIPKKFSKKKHWFDDHEEMNKGNIETVKYSLDNDLKETEELLNILYDLFISKFEEFLEREKILINY